MFFIRAFITLITCHLHDFTVFLRTRMLNCIDFRYIFEAKKNRNGQKDEFLGCTMTSHGFKSDMDGF